MKVEPHTDGTFWTPCLSDEPKYEKFYELDGTRIRTYHPEAIVTDKSWDECDTEYTCPHCKKSWWIEIDG